MDFDAQMIVVMFLLQVMDGVTTYISLELGGKEVNPIMRKAMKYLGTLPALILAKSLVALVLLYTEPDSVVAVNIFYFAVVVINVLTILSIVGEWEDD